LTQARQAIDLFQPDALVLSLGFDIFEKDPQAMVSVTEDGFERLGRAVGGMRLPTLIVQEGGYYIEGLESNASRFFAGLTGA
jgi:acetoin utilization deacetylase AcuC-like enzyme